MRERPIAINRQRLAGLGPAARARLRRVGVGRDQVGEERRERAPDVAGGAPLGRAPRSRSAPVPRWPARPFRPARPRCGGSPRHDRRCSDAADRRIAASCFKTGHLVPVLGLKAQRRAGRVFRASDGLVCVGIAESLGFSGQIGCDCRSTARHSRNRTIRDARHPQSQCFR